MLLNKAGYGGVGLTERTFEETCVKPCGYLGQGVPGRRAAHAKALGVEACHMQRPWGWKHALIFRERKETILAGEEGGRWVAVGDKTCKGARGRLESGRPGFYCE